MSWLIWENCSASALLCQKVHSSYGWVVLSGLLALQEVWYECWRGEKKFVMLLWIHQLDWRCVASNTHWGFWYSSSQIIRGSAHHCFPAGMNYGTHCALTCSCISGKCACSRLMWSQSAGRTSALCLCDQDSWRQLLFEHYTDPSQQVQECALLEACNKTQVCFYTHKAPFSI